MTLRELRIAHNVSIDEVAALLTIDRAYYSRLELGRRPLSTQQLEALRWRYGWEVEAQQPQAEMCSRRSKVSHRSEQPATQGEMLALMGMAAFKANGGEIPQDWRNWRRHPELWARAISASRMYRRTGRSRVA